MTMTDLVWVCVGALLMVLALKRLGVLEPVDAQLEARLRVLIAREEAVADREEAVAEDEQRVALERREYLEAWDRMDARAIARVVAWRTAAGQVARVARGFRAAAREAIVRCPEAERLPLLMRLRHPTAVQIMAWSDGRRSVRVRRGRP